MNIGEENNNLIDPQMDKNEDQNIEWDNENPTYGHAISQSSFKRKDAPDEEHLSDNADTDDSNVITDLKNSSLSNNIDLGNKNNDEEKGVGGKTL